LQQVTQSHSCKLEAHDESEWNRTPWFTLRQQGPEREERGGGKEKEEIEDNKEKVFGDVTKKNTSVVC